jgi:uncharacterized protein YndB with AHSA1/START domain
MIVDMIDTVPTARVTRSFDLPVGRLFDAWLETSLLSRWMFGQNVREEEIVRLSNDPRKGGRFSFVVRRQAKEIDHTGVYREISRPHRLVFTWAAVQAGKSDGESVVVLDFEPLDLGSELRLAHELPAEWANFTEQSVQAWTKMLDALAKHVT